MEAERAMGDHKYFSVYVKDEKGPMARAIEAMCRKDALSDSEFARECILMYFESVGLYDTNTGKWDVKKLELLEAKHPPKPKHKLSRKVVLDDEEKESSKKDVGEKEVDDPKAQNQKKKEKST
jgi:hypothetical protein